jgi:ubiquinone/menaquinone biosynthesis C-methylase UbiE
MTTALEPAAAIEGAKDNRRPGALHFPGAQPRLVSAKRGYALWAQSYDHDANPLLALEERLLPLLLPNLEGKRVLDLACGTGRWLSKLGLLGARPLVGIDFSSAMLDVAKRKPLLRGRLARADCLALPLRSAFADVLVCAFALGHVADLTALARELVRVAGPQADIYTSDLHPAAYARGWRTGFRRKGKALEIATVVHSLPQLREAFASQDLELVRSMEGCLGDPERPIFAQANQLGRFREVCGVPAIVVCHFRRAPAATSRPWAQ